MLSGTYWPISDCGSLKGAQHLYSAQGASTRVWKMSKHLAEMELESPRRAWAQDFSGTGGGEGLGAPGGSQSTGWHSPHRPFPKSPRGRHSLASKFAFQLVISSAAFPAGRKSDMTAPATAPCALSHPLPLPRWASETQGPPHSPGHPPHSLHCSVPSAGTNATKTRETALHRLEDAEQAFYPILQRGLSPAQTQN